MRPFYQVPNSSAALQYTSQLPTYQHPNENDFCLADEALLMNELIGKEGLEGVCCPRGRRPYAQRPWITMPAEGRRFRPIGTLPIPAGIPLNVEYTVMTMTVPIGYDGIIMDVVCEIVAPSNQSTGFTEGSGDIIWRLRCNAGGPGRLTRDLGNIKTTLGSLIYPSPVPRSGNRILSADVLNFTVTFAGGAQADLNPSANIICSISGWVYPR